jgi:hypothetical protein
MARVTNLTRSGMDFIVGVKDGAAVTEHLKAGETRDLNIDVESATVKGRLVADAIKIGAPARRATAKTENAD